MKTTLEIIFEDDSRFYHVTESKDCMEWVQEISDKFKAMNETRVWSIWNVETKYLPSCNLIYNDGETIFPISEMAFQVNN